MEFEGEPVASPDVADTSSDQVSTSTTANDASDDDTKTNNEKTND
jgi:hypothetical protein